MIGFAQPVILTRNCSFIPLPGMAIMSLFQNINNHLETLPLFLECCCGYLDMTTCCYDHLAIMPLFQEVIITNLSRLCSTPVTLPILPTKSPIWIPLIPDIYKLYKLSHIQYHSLTQGMTPHWPVLDALKKLKLVLIRQLWTRSFFLHVQV